MKNNQKHSEDHEFEPSKPVKKSVYVFHKMRIIGLFLWFSGSVRLFKDGDGFSVIFRWWHPVTWLFEVLMILPCALAGEPLREAVPVRLNSFWEKNKSQLQFVTPWTRLDTLKNFNFKIDLDSI